MSDFCYLNVTGHQMSVGGYLQEVKLKSQKENPLIPVHAEKLMKKLD